MSGGHFDYAYHYIKDMFENEMQDADMNELLLDFVEVLHDLEWWQSCDISEEDYRKTVSEFKYKWLNGYDETSEARIERFKKSFIEKMTAEINKL